MVRPRHYIKGLVFFSSISYRYALSNGNETVRQYIAKHLSILVQGACFQNGLIYCLFTQHITTIGEGVHQVSLITLQFVQLLVKPEINDQQINECYWQNSLNGIGTILGMGSANERRHYSVTSSLVGWDHTQHDPWWQILHTQGH